MTTPTVPVPVPVGPPVPSSADAETTFDAAMEAFLTWQRDGLQPGVNALANSVFDNAQLAQLATSVAQDASATAGQAASVAVASANFKGAWSDLVGALSIPASVSHSGAVWALVSSVADVTAHTPGLSAVWLAVTGSAPTLSGPPLATPLYTTYASTWQITNYDSAADYVLSTTNGTVSRTGDTITYTPATVGAGGFTVNGKVFGGYTVALPSVGQVAFTTPGTYTWVCPPGIQFVCGVTVGAGAGRTGHSSGCSGGGALGFKNNVPVVPGQSYTVVVGASTPGASGGASTFAALIGAEGGKHTGAGLVYSNPLYGCSGGRGVRNGASSWFSGGGGAGGYTGDGGYPSGTQTTFNGAGGGGGAGGGCALTDGSSGAGGGVGLLGPGASGVGGTPSGREGGGGGSAGTNGGAGATGDAPPAASGGLFGGGAPSHWHTVTTQAGLVGGGGGVRLIWGLGRAFPSTNTGDM